MMTEKAIGIMGGTFDPIHFGHLFIAAAAVEQFSLDNVIFVPSALSPHKLNKTITSPEMRYEMTLLATLDNAKFSVSRVEIERGGLSYTIDTVKYFQEKYPEHKIYFITGADTILDVAFWKSPEELMQNVYFLAAKRPGYSLDDLKSEFYQKYSDRIFFMQIPQIGISSTEIRERVEKDKSIKYYLPTQVETYIKKVGLYC